MKIKDGDIFIYGSDSFISKVIMEAQSLYWELLGKRSLFSHTGFIFPSEKQIVHSTIDIHFNPKNIFTFGKKPILQIESGIQVDPITVLKGKSKLAVIQLNLSDKERKKIKKIAYQMTKEDHKYPIDELFGTLFAILFAWAFNDPRKALKKNILDNPTQYYCCAFVLEVLHRAGYDVWNCLDPSATTVDHLFYIEYESKICEENIGKYTMMDIVKNIDFVSYDNLVRML